MQIHGSTQAHGAHKIAGPHFQPKPTASQATSQGTSLGGDKLEISSVGQVAADQVETGGARSERIAEIRNQIAQGVYETPDKLDAALDRLLDELG